MSAAKEAVSKELDALKAENRNQGDELKALQSSSSAADEESRGLIKKLEAQTAELKESIAANNEALSANQEQITRLQAGLSEEKVNNDGLTIKAKALEDQVE